MAQKTIYIHIGTHKTGTSSIQKTMSNNDELLLANDYLYPRQSRVFQTGHHNLVYEYYSPSQFVSERGSMAEMLDEFEQSSASNLLLSSENFYWFEQDHIDAFISHLPKDAEKRVVIYLRRQDEFLQSAIVQSFKTLLWKEPIDEWPTKYEQHGLRGDYAAILQLWANAVGANNVMVRPFERSQMAKGDLLYDFLKTVRLPEVHNRLHAHNAENISPGNITLAFIQAYYNNISSEEEDVAWIAYQKEFLRQLLQYSASQYPTQQRYNIIDANVHRQVMSKFAETNRLVAQRYLGRTQLFTEPFKQKPIASVENVSLSNADYIEAFVQCGYAVNDKNVRRAVWETRRKSLENRKVLKKTYDSLKLHAGQLEEMLHRKDKQIDQLKNKVARKGV